MIFNVYFAPQSFGGATIVAEELAKRLKDTFDILVITTIQHADMPQYNSFRYKAKGVDVVGINIQQWNGKINQFINPLVAVEVSKWIELFQPDVIHSHCIQNLGAEYINSVYQQNIPHIMTIHDSWWICERQFMVDNHGEYCNTIKIDEAKCESCMNSIDAELGLMNSTHSRRNYLVQQLSKIDLIVFPSNFQKNLYKANMPEIEGKFVINNNGVSFPAKGFEKSKKSKNKVRFGFVGGIGPLKGSEQILMAFSMIKASNYELKIVDNTLNLGFSSVNINKKDFKGKVIVSPAYTQESLDDFFSGIDVLLFPTQSKESFGLTVREALIRDVWVIATDSGGVIECIVEGVNGNIIPLTKDYTYLKNSIENLLDKDFSKYKNIHKENIISYNTQAKELKKMLLGLINNKKEKNAHK
jgi:glycosyltransferase involved in cell wall biosynthesis